MKNKVVWITGASSGIGEALCYHFNELGCRLIISSRNRDKLYEVKSHCRRNPIDVHVLPLDLEDSASLPGKAEDALKIYGHIDIIVHSGGISQRSLALETKTEVAQRLMNINFWGTQILSLSLLPSMLQRGSGHIVVISSIVGKFGTPLRSAYSATKHALHGYFDSLRAETDPRIRFLIVCPGFIKTAVSLNALTADGSSQNSMDEAQANGMAPDKCVELIVKAIRDNREEVYIGGKETYGVWLKRFFPRYFSKMIRKAKVT